MFTIIFFLGICGTLFYLLFKPINSLETIQQTNYLQEDELALFISNVSYSEAKPNA